MGGVAEPCLVGVAGRLLQGLRGWRRGGLVLLAQLGRAVEGIRGYGCGGASVSCASRVSVVLVARHLRGPLLLLVIGVVGRVFVGIGRRVGHCNGACRLDD
jgi:hypothetical protein